MVENFFQSLENPNRIFQPLEQYFPIIGNFSGGWGVGSGVVDAAAGGIAGAAPESAAVGAAGAEDHGGTAFRAGGGRVG